MELFATAAISCAKGSAAVFIHQIVGVVHRRLQHSLLIITAAYAVFAMFAAAFQCSGSAPRYWLYTPRACGHGALDFGTKGGSRTKPHSNTNLALNPDLRQTDAESDHGSQTGILRTTTIKFDHVTAGMQAPEPRSRPDLQEQYKW